jgi:hypothetical protein
MNIIFDKSPFFSPVTKLLRELAVVDFFSHGLLIGSWPMIIYADHFTLPYALMTNDIDFAVSGAIKVPDTPRETIPKLMERLGYSALNDYSGIETFLQGEFEVEFLTHRKGGRSDQASVVVQPWQVSAQPLPFIDMLFIRPVTVAIEDFKISIPSPEALMLHKLIIAQRRTGPSKDEKKEKDLQQCSALVNTAQTDEVQQILADYRMSKDVQRSLETSCAEAAIKIPGGLPWKRLS